MLCSPQIRHEVAQASHLLLQLGFDYWLLLLEVLSDSSQALLLKLHPFMEIQLWIRAVFYLGVFLLADSLHLNVFLFARDGKSLDLIDHTHCLQVFYVSVSWLVNYFEEVHHVLLFELVVIGFDTFEEPLWIFNLGHRVHALLQSGWDCHNLLNGSTKPLLVVVPIDY